MSLTAKTIRKAQTALIEMEQDGSGFIAHSKSSTGKTYSINLEATVCRCKGFAIHGDCYHLYAVKMFKAQNNI